MAISQVGSRPGPTTCPATHAPNHVTSSPAAISTRWTNPGPVPDLVPVCSAAGSVARYAVLPAGGLPSLRRGYQFQKPLRVVQHLAELILLVAQCYSGKLRRHARFLQARIRGHEADLIHTDALCARQRGFQLFGQFGCFGFAGGEREGETHELVLGNAGIELDAG